MDLRQWTEPRDPWRPSLVERLRGFVILWVVPIAVVMMLAFFAAAHP